MENRNTNLRRVDGNIVALEKKNQSFGLCVEVMPNSKRKNYIFGLSFTHAVFRFGT